MIISGNPPAGINENFYAQLITTLKEKSVKVIIDADRGALKSGVNAEPYLIKPNMHEFGRLVEKNIVDIDEVVEYAKPYQNIIEYIIVSIGARGVIGISKVGNYHVIPPKVKVKSSVGAGDSLIAGVVYALSEGKEFEEAMVLGVAYGAASTLNQESGLCTREDVFDIKKDIVVKKL